MDPITAAPGRRLGYGAVGSPAVDGTSNSTVPTTAAAAAADASYQHQISDHPTLHKAISDTLSDGKVLQPNAIQSTSMGQHYRPQKAAPADGTSTDHQATPASNGDSSKQRIPLIDYIHSILLDFLKQQLSPEALEAEAAANNGGTTSSSIADPLQQLTLQLMSAESLLTNQQLYLWLNDALLGVQVRTQIINNNPRTTKQHKGIAWLEPLKPADVYHTFEGQHYPNPKAAAAALNTDGRISCLDHLRARYSTDLQHPDLPCIAVKLSGTACQDLPLEEQFIHYPLELCGVMMITADGPAKRDPIGVPAWATQRIDSLCTTADPDYQAAVPEWVAAVLNKRYRTACEMRMAEAGGAATAEAAENEEALGVASGQVSEHAAVAANNQQTSAVAAAAPPPQAATAAIVVPDGSFTTLTPVAAAAAAAAARTVVTAAAAAAVDSYATSVATSSDVCHSTATPAAPEPVCCGPNTAALGLSNITAATSTSSSTSTDTAGDTSSSSSSSSGSSSSCDSSSSAGGSTFMAACSPQLACHSHSNRMHQSHLPFTAAQAASAAHRPAATAAAAGLYGLALPSQPHQQPAASLGAAAAAGRPASTSVILPTPGVVQLPTVPLLSVGSMGPSTADTAVGATGGTSQADVTAGNIGVCEFGSDGIDASISCHNAPIQMLATTAAYSAATTVSGAGAVHQAAPVAFSQPQIVMDPAAAGVMIASLVKQLQPLGVHALPQQQEQQQQQQQQQQQPLSVGSRVDVAATQTHLVHRSRLDFQAPVGYSQHTMAGTIPTPVQQVHIGYVNASCQAAGRATPAVAALSASSSSPQAPCYNMQGNAQDTAGSSSSSSSGGGSGGSRCKSVQEGFSELLSKLYPSKQQHKQMINALTAVCEAIPHADAQQNPVEWRVAEVIKAGSFVKKTSLNITSDLDVVVKLICYHRPFHHCRRKLLQAIVACLCRPVDTSSSSRHRLDSGWVLRDCYTHYYVKLQHPVLGFTLDIQVAQHFGPIHQQRKQVLGKLLATAEQLEQSQAHSSSSSKRSTDNPAHTSQQSVYSSRERVTNLAELTTEVITGVDQRMSHQHEVHGMGRLCTDIIRALKAWSKFGLPKALEAATAECSSGPPGYILEVVVVHVLEQGLQASQVYDQRNPLQFFKDVLQAASEQLRSTAKKSAAIILPVHYTRQQAMMKVFQDEWGPDGWPYSPYIISPVDPSYNCTEYAAFRSWDVLATAAGELLQQIKRAEGMGAGGWSWLCDNSTLGPVAKEFEVAY